MTDTSWLPGAGKALLPVLAAAALLGACYEISRHIDFAADAFVPSVLGVITVGAILRRAASGEAHDPQRPTLRLAPWRLALMAALATAVLASLSTSMLHHHVGYLASVKDGTRLDSSARLQTNADVAWEYLLYSGADAIPVLKVPDTLGWKPERRPAGVLQGAVLLTFKILILVPLLVLIAWVYKAEKPDGKEGAETNDASGSPTEAATPEEADSPGAGAAQDDDPSA